jgi:bifunctional non-homologous end joining protein LigD
MPSELSQVVIAGFEESGAYIYLRNVNGLLALAQMGVLEVHPWNAHVDRPDRPDQIIFDLDPGNGLGFADVVSAAHEIRAALLDQGLVSFAKTTGGKGVHVVVPIERRYTWQQVKAFARSFGEMMSREAPDRYLTRISIVERRGRIFIDYLRNDATSTAVAPYSTRSRPGAPVSTPLTWDELTPTLNPLSFTIETVPQRLQDLKRDPWAEHLKTKQRLPWS